MLVAWPWYDNFDPLPLLLPDQGPWHFLSFVKTRSHVLQDTHKRMGTLQIAMQRHLVSIKPVSATRVSQGIQVDPPAEKDVFCCLDMLPTVLLGWICVTTPLQAPVNASRLEPRGSTNV